MTDRIKLLADQCTENIDDGGYGYEVFDKEKFAELIVRECITSAKSVSELRGANDDMIYGADTAALQIAKHFGIKD